jgi:hypothetical protein
MQRALWFSGPGSPPRQGSAAPGSAKGSRQEEVEYVDDDEFDEFDVPSNEQLAQQVGVESTLWPVSAIEGTHTHSLTHAHPWCPQLAARKAQQGTATAGAAGAWIGGGAAVPWTKSPSVQGSGNECVVIDDDDVV